VTVDQSDQSNAHSGDRHSIFESLGKWFRRLDAVRGVIAAIALVTFIAALSPDFMQQFLKLTHALASRANVILSQAVGWLSHYLPFKLYVSPAEASAWLYIATILIPSCVVHVAAVGRVRSRVSDSRGSTSLLGTYAMIGAIGSGLLLVGVVVFMLNAALSSDDWLADQRVSSMFLTLIVWDLVNGIMLLWAFHRAYLKGLLFALAVFATLEVLYHLPVIGGALEDLASRIEALPTSTPP